MKKEKPSPRIEGKVRTQQEAAFELLDIATTSLAHIASSLREHNDRQAKFTAIFTAYLNSPLTGLVLSTELHGEIAEHALKLRKEIIAIMNS